MKVALRGSYVEFVIFMGVNESYPRWFEKIIEESIVTDESNYTFYVDRLERRPDYYEKTLIEDYSVFIRKPDGEIFVTNYEVFSDLYVTFRFCLFSNSGIAAFEDDSIDYVECRPGGMPAGYPHWFYEYFTEAMHFPIESEVVLFHGEEKEMWQTTAKDLLIDNDGFVTVLKHCVFLKNKFNEIRGIAYDDFIKYYDPTPAGGVDHDS